MSEIEQVVGEAAERGSTLTLAVDELSPKRVLEILAEVGSSHRVQIHGPAGRITVEVGNGLVVGAQATLRGRAFTGKDAYACIMHVTDGEMRIEGLRFPSMANILKPVHDLLDLAGPVGPEPKGDDTVEVALPQARPRHEPTAVEPETEEVELDLDDDPITQNAPMPDFNLGSMFQPATREHRAPRSRRRRAVLASAFAAVVVTAVGVVWSLGATPSGPVEPIAAVATSPIPVSAHLPSTEVDMDLRDLEVDEAGRGANFNEARALARSARVRLRSGDAPGALEAARRAARIRGGRPFYQVLLGDALRANGRRAAAHRAYRRAVRLRPGYRPAILRLQSRRRARVAGSRNSSPS